MFAEEKITSSHMIPLSYFLIAWFIFLAIYLLMALISVLQMVRLGLAGAGTFLSTAVFLVVVVLVILGTGGYLVTVDWQQLVNPLAWLTSTPIFTP